MPIGRLGTLALVPGWYVYVGSALRGLEARLRRHLRPKKPRHWHADYLREVADLAAIAYRVGSERLECAVAAQFAALLGVNIPAPNFGSSDCRCRSHLFHFAEMPDLELDTSWESVWL